MVRLANETKKTRHAELGLHTVILTTRFQTRAYATAGLSVHGVNVLSSATENINMIYALSRHLMVEIRVAVVSHHEWREALGEQSCVHPDPDPDPDPLP